MNASRSDFSSPPPTPPIAAPVLPQTHPGSYRAGGPTTGPVTDPTIGPVTDPTIGARPSRTAGAAAARDTAPATGTDANTAVQHPSATLAFQTIEQSEGFQALSAAERQQLQQVIGQCGIEGLRHLAAIVSRDPARLTAPVPAPHKGTVLSELARLSRADLHPQLSSAGVSKGQALDAVLADVANPRDVLQGSAGTCTVTSMQYDLVSREPGEYVRIIADLATSGRSTLRGDGDAGGGRDVLRLQTEYLVPTRVGDKRRLTENWFQSAAMELANGALDYEARTDVSVNDRWWRSGEFAPGETHPGLYGAQQQRMLQALFGVRYDLHEGTPGGNLDLLRRHSGLDDGYPVLLNLQFDGHAPGGTQGPVTDPTIGIGGGEGAGKGRGSHAVTFSHIEGTGAEARVYFRDPWGRGEAMPPATWDEKTGMYFMTAPTFEQRCERIHVADEPSQKGLRDRFAALGAVFGL